MKFRKFLALSVLGALFLTACGGGEETGPTTDSGDNVAEAGDDNPDGRTVRIAFSFPGADHGWLAAITEFARAEAERYDDVEFIPIEGTNDSAAQASQVETLISQNPDVLIILPHEGDALTPVALAAMEAGIPVVNVDREFSTPAAYRTWIGGDNYGIGKSAADFIANELNCQGNVVEIQGVAGISVTDDRTEGFATTIEAECGSGIEIIAQQPADFLPYEGLQVMEAILQANPDIDAVYTHDDDMSEGVVAAIENANREDEMILTGAGGSCNAFDRIEEDGLYSATYLYSPTMAGSAVNMARLIGQNRGFAALLAPEVPSEIIVPPTEVTADNVDELRELCFD
jgi:ribose transport system substrate-binding protein